MSDHTELPTELCDPGGSMSAGGAPDLDCRRRTWVSVVSVSQRCLTKRWHNFVKPLLVKKRPSGDTRGLVDYSGWFTWTGKPRFPRSH